MTTIDSHVPAATVDAVAPLERASSVVEWVTTSDHKRIGRLFVGVGALAALGVTATGALLGFERIDAGSDSLGGDAIGKLFSAFRVGLPLVVVLPVMLGIAIAVLPLQLGARSLAFPRLAAAGFYAWLFGTATVIGSIIADGGPGGTDGKAVDLYVLGLGLLVLGLLAASTSVLVSVLTTRAPGMNMRRVPPFAWSALVTSLGLVLMLPVLLGTLLYTYLANHYHSDAFGGAAGLQDWIGFPLTQPQTYLYAIPAFGIAAEVVAMTSRRRLPMRGVLFGGLGLLGVSALAGVSQVSFGLRRDITDTSFGTFLGDALPWAIFLLLPLLGALVVLGVGSLALTANRRPRITAPFVFAFLGVGLVFVGLAAGALQQIGDAQLQGTVFEEGAFVAVGYGAVLAALGGVAYWGPKLWGRRIPDAAALPLAALGFLAVAAASLPYLVAGFAKQPAGVTTFDYDGPQDLWNVLAAIGHALFFVVVLAFIALALKSFVGGEAAGDDPWQGQTLEWATTSPAPVDNFVEVQVVTSAEPLLDLRPAGAPAPEGSDA
jgi:heme/copper-type cytochrome/quinol oxidase subunit 1